ncbi:unnamed protein product [Effrenium voratum]|uniref:Uncharacterized protein n=1 Tax=Effrenium voratum TaxID=2562239 RepID=A0AA36JKD3_9DINO|nr:unnamed protein product [Effrenium voratum]CAJ1407822.1 unnamed protein product [Effrenium voratum]CAJ1431175.1 unnamed protein product [Effrenium voratum]|mmetsp:Transcript_28119/g.66770  ORF Transcript_28119/g.66770 Transcript_28119/m.66770 type:complete len:274 (+) Transcript_28119:10-831(+)
MDALEQLARSSSNDSERTRLLKQVLSSSARLQRELRVTLGTPATKGSKFSTFTTAAKKKQELPVNATESLPDKLQLCAQGHDDICESINPHEMSPVLKSCGERIGLLSDKLSAAQEQLVLRAGSLPEREEDDSHVIEIVARGQQASAATRHRAEAAAERALMQHARFGALEDLQGVLQQSFEYDDLRKAFPRRSRWNPNLYLLTDETLKNPQEFKDAVWRKLSKDVEEEADSSQVRLVRWRRTVGAPSRGSILKTDPGAKALARSPGTRSSIL